MSIDEYRQQILKELEKLTDPKALELILELIIRLQQD